MTTAQRWARPEVMAGTPGYWSWQMRTKHLKIAAQGDVAALEQLLKAHPEYLSQRANHNRTLVWEAARSGKLDAVKYLVSQGAEVNATGSYNNETFVQVTPYCAAIYYKRPAIAEYLWAHGSKLDVFRAAFLGDHTRVARMLKAKPALLNAEDPFDSVYLTPLVSFAVVSGNIGLIEFLLQQGAAVEPYSVQLLYLAAKINRTDVVDLLIAHGADAGAADLCTIISTSDVPMIRYLLDKGVTTRQSSINGFPPLVFAARGDKGDHPEKIELLLEYGADVNERGPAGKTALHYATAAGHAKVMALLLGHGAAAHLKDDKGQTAEDIASVAGKAFLIALESRRKGL